MADRAYVVEGAVIISDDGTHVRYHPQCPKCGNVEQSTTGSGHVGQGIRASLGGYSCFKCGNMFTVKISRGC